MALAYKPSSQASFFGNREQVQSSFLERILVSVVNSSFPSVGKKPGGSDTGGLNRYQDFDYITKLGMNFSLLGQAVMKHLQNKEDKVLQKFNIIVGTNFNKFAAQGLSKEAAEALKIKLKEEAKTLKSAFDAYLSSVEGKRLLEKANRIELGEGVEFSPNEIYDCYLELVKFYPKARDLIGLPALADITSGAFSQALNNELQSQIGIEGAEHKIFSLTGPDVAGSIPMLLQGSRFLNSKTARPFDKFLLQPFEMPKSEDESEEDYTNKCLQTVKEKLGQANLKGLCSAILFRLLMGESADNNPDNMLLTEKGIVNIDLTGFRYPRKDNKELKDRKTGAPFTEYGWNAIFEEAAIEGLLTKLFDKSVFKERYITDDNSPVPKEIRGAVHQHIVEYLKEFTRSQVADEVAAVKQWFASLVSKDGDIPLIEQLNKATQNVYESLPEELRPNRVHLDQLQEFQSGFIKTTAEAALKCVNEAQAAVEKADMDIDGSRRP